MHLIKNFLQHIAFIFCFIATSSVFCGETSENSTNPKTKKIIIAGICQNVANAVPNTIQNIEELGSLFADYAVVIYENNSSDDTVSLFNQWAQRNLHVTFVTETLQKSQLPKTRTEKIARARNIVLSLIRDPKYNDFEYTLMVDLDFTYPWPIHELLETLKSPQEWDCVACNGLAGNHYYDRYAFRSTQYPFGPEILGGWWWGNLKKTPFSLKGAEWVPVYSAFGGLALYKTATIIQFSYSGTVTEDLKKYCNIILSSLSSNNTHLTQYKQLLRIKKSQRPTEIKFRQNTPMFGLTTIPTCCEHVPFHASMALNGHDKFYVNPMMKMFYCK